ncbi:hypothetical protein M9H77_27003 [Catharanthus roseus]|uniref:Uncharacterized protein n=1 Tax=Catharanthus roseus TaxID=4058 RepID=A0ACC0ABG2_CATRO|nr:hypothetical protein M9H77_27003 [Catharanthus roseus]
MKDGRRVKRRPTLKPILFLPDDVVMEILSRMPVVDVLKCRRVCRRWNSLILTSCFSDMHRKNHSSFPMIVVQEKLYCYNMTNLLLLVDRLEPSRKRTKLRKFCVDSILPVSKDLFIFRLHYDGLFVMGNLNVDRFVIFNPITRDKVNLMIPTVPECDVMGMFFHPLIKEYCIIWGSFVANPKPLFKMVNLSSKPFCKDINPSASLVEGRILHSKDPKVPVVIEKDAILYWMVDNCPENHSCEETIMAFDIKSEEFSFVPHPGPRHQDCNHEKHLNMQIFKMDGHLSLLQKTTKSRSVFIIDIWSLKDSAAGLWMKIHSVPINIDQLGNVGWFDDRYFVAMVVVNGELFAHYRWRGWIQRIFGCNLETGIVRRMSRTYTYCCMDTYIPSFVSLKNCRSEIRI